MAKRYGTRAFTGLKTQVAEHLMGDGDLAQADNANYDILGAAKAEGEDDSYPNATFANPAGVGWGLLDGSPYTFWKDVVGGNGYYKQHNGTTVATIGNDTHNTSRLYVAQGKDEVVLTDGGPAWAWDGDLIRKLGPLEGSDTITGVIGAKPRVLRDDSGTVSVADITISSGTVTVETGSAHGKTTGEQVYIDSVAGTTEINGFVYTVTVTDTTHFTLDDTDGSDWTAYDSAGTVYVSGCGLDGAYSYKVSYTATLPDGRVIESSLTDLAIQGEDDFTGTFEPEKRANIVVRGVSATDVTDWTGNTSTWLTAHLGVDLLMGARVYRTRAGGASYYLLETVAHASIYEQTNGYYSFNDQVMDKDLGAAWAEDTYDAHDQPPDCSLFTVSRGRAYCVDNDNQNRLHWSATGRYDYWTPTAYHDFADDITAIVPAGQYLAVFSRTRLWVFDHYDAIGARDEIVLQQGVDSPTAAVSVSGAVAFENGLGTGAVVFANDLGLWSVSSGGLSELSAHVRDDWIEAASGGTWHLVIHGDRLICACDNGLGSSDQAFVIKMAGGEMQWARTDQPTTYDYEGFSSDPVNNVIIAQCADGVFKFGADSDNTKTMQLFSKWYGDGRYGNATRLVVDISGNTTGTVSLITNMQSLPKTYTVENDGSKRRVIHVEINPTGGQFWQIGYTGPGTIYGWALDVNEAPDIY